MVKRMKKNMNKKEENRKQKIKGIVAEKKVERN